MRPHAGIDLEASDIRARPLIRFRRAWVGMAAAPLVLVAGVLAGCGPTHGAVEVTEAGELIFTAAAGRANVVTVTPAGADLLISDAGDSITPGSGCTAEDADTARCAGALWMRMDLGDGNDRAANNTGVPSNSVIPGGPAGIRGGPGNDVLDGGTAADLLTGDEGTDTLNGNGGGDLLNEGWTTASTDVLDADTFNGGPGRDFARYNALQDISVDLDGVADDGRPGEGDNVRSDIEDITGGGGDDVLIGDGDANFLIGSAGDDELVGNLGNDILRGANGNDRLIEATGATNTDALDADTFIGDAQVDIVSYESATASVRVDLDDVADDGRQATPVSPAEGDNVSSDVEDVAGGGGNDSLFGDGDNNLLIGNAGADFISGDAGNDFLRGNAGFDPLDGGEGTDDCDVGGVGPDGGSVLNCET